MSKIDWYRNTSWNEQIESEFEARIKRLRKDFYKAQKLRIQASCLLDASKEKLQEKGIELMERLIKVYPNEEFSTIYANEQLGDFYFKKKSFEKAEKYFRLVTEYYYEETRSGTSCFADLKLCETILITNQEDKFREAYEMATVKFKESDGSVLLTHNSDKFYYADLMANLCYLINRKEEASKFADTALELSKITEPQFSRHKTIGLINAEKEQLERLKRIKENKSLVTSTAIKNSSLSNKLKNIFKK